jgi:ssDNA-binding Zn-finger/Zn-ribbon topoisomerase 1
MTETKPSDGDDVCPVCGGDGVLIRDDTDARGERTDEVIPCPECGEDEYRELDEPEGDALEKWWP